MNNTTTNTNTVDVAFRWLDTDRLSVVQDIKRFESLEEAAEYNYYLYLDQLEAGNVAVELEVEDFVEALRWIIEREGLNDMD